MAKTFNKEVYLTNKRNLERKKREKRKTEKEHFLGTIL